MNVMFKRTLTWRGRPARSPRITRDERAALRAASERYEAAGAK